MSFKELFLFIHTHEKNKQFKYSRRVEFTVTSYSVIWLLMGCLCAHMVGINGGRETEVWGTANGEGRWGSELLQKGTVIGGWWGRNKL